MGNDRTDPAGSPLSLQRLTAAFAQMLGGVSQADVAVAEEPAGDPCEISPRSIVEGILFVGSQDQRPHTAEQLAQSMRDVTPTEVHQAVAELNEGYERDGSPYCIHGGAEGYRLTLRDEMSRMRDKFYGRVREARLSPKALEVLSVVAYKQPTTAGAIDALRGTRSRPLLTQLVRRGLVKRETSKTGQGEPCYCTTDRFLAFFRLEGLEQLPRAAELDD